VGGIVCVFSFSIAMFVVAGLAGLTNVHEDIILPLQAAMTVFIAAAIIGFIDDIGLLSRRQKAALIIFAATPMVFLRPAKPELDLILTQIGFSGYSPFGFDLLLLIFWLLVVPVGIMASANAFFNLGDNARRPQAAGL
jgi:UDP-N-acetylmuramyl pentapeptide phosphotransferase/UDP-N-acetylglucosamine-1-phosphate transferase